MGKKQHVNQKQDWIQTASVKEKKNEILPARFEMTEIEIIQYQKVCQVLNSQIQSCN